MHPTVPHPTVPPEARHMGWMFFSQFERTDDAPFTIGVQASSAEEAVQRLEAIGYAPISLKLKYQDRDAAPGTWHNCNPGEWTHGLDHTWMKDHPWEQRHEHTWVRSTSEMHLDDGRVFYVSQSDDKVECSE